MALNHILSHSPRWLAILALALGASAGKAQIQREDPSLNPAIMAR